MKNPQLLAAIMKRYASAPPAAQRHIRIRWRLAPFDAIAAHVPTTGRILDYGCGHGLLAAYLFSQAPTRKIVGVDIDADKIAIAQAAGGDDFEFQTLSDNPPPGPYDCIVVADVLYLMSRDEQQATLAKLSRLLAPAGTLIVKEMALRPRWKHWWGTFEEFLAVRVLRITKGTDLVFASPADLAGWLVQLGFQVQGERVDRGYVHPHYLTRAVRE